MAIADLAKHSCTFEKHPRNDCDVGQNQLLPPRKEHAIGEILCEPQMHDLSTVVAPLRARGQAQPGFQQLRGFWFPSFVCPT